MYTLYSTLSFRDGQRVFHPAEEFDGWFTVEVVDENTIKAHFDDGRSPSLVQKHHLSGQVDRILRQESDEVFHWNSMVTLRTNLEIFPWHKASKVEALITYFEIVKKNEGGRKEEAIEKLKKYVTN